MIFSQCLKCKDEEMSGTIHEPVMVEKVTENLLREEDGIYVDATLGCGGHTGAILESSRATVVGFDLDFEQIKVAVKELEGFSDRFLPLLSSYVLMDRLIEKKVNGILFDFGFSSFQLDDADRGFSYRKDGPLDMRYGPTGTSVRDIIKNRNEEEIADILYYYGGEHFSRRIARKIKREEPETTGDLALIVRKSVPRKKGHKHLGRVFQAFRIAANNERQNIKDGITAASNILSPGHRVVTITYHSGEEKLAMDTAGLNGLEMLTGKPLKPEREEFERNPRCRSAHLRVFEK